MTDRNQLLEAALDCYPEGIALLDREGRVVVWNRAAEAITGYACMEVLSRQVPQPLERLRMTSSNRAGAVVGAEPTSGRGVILRFEHKLGHQLPVIERDMVLRDEMGARIGLAVIFHSAESLDALPHGECGEGSSVEEDRTEFEDRLAGVFEDFIQGGESFGVLWIIVDQAYALRKTHGIGACNAMLEKVERALASGLRPAEEMGRWGDDEFLILSHERTPEMLASHAQVLAGLARTAEFRWWGDRVSLTVSIGTAQAELEESLCNLLERARVAMFSSLHEGGNHITSAPGVQACSPL